MNKRISLVLIALILLPGCEAIQKFIAPAAMEARDDVISLRGDIKEFAGQIKDLGVLSAEGEAKVDEITAAISDRVNAITEKLEPDVVGAVGVGLKEVGNALGGTPGSVLGGLGIVATFLAERRRRKRTVRSVVASVEHGRDGATIDWKKVGDAQNMMGIRRLVRDVSMEVSGDLAHE